MSHFTVLVIGNDPEKQLEPYDENIRVEEYLVGPVNQSDIDSFIRYYTESSRTIPIEKKEKNKLLTFDQLYEFYGNEWNGRDWKKDENGIWSEYSTYNPKSKWDWYQLGGRWTGFLKLKEGVKDSKTGKPGLMSSPAKPGYCDQTIKKNIDFEGMKNDAAFKATEEYKNVLNIFDGEIPKIDFTWDDLMKNKEPMYELMDVNQKRYFYHIQPALKIVNEKSGKLDFFFDIEDFQCTMEEYVENERKKAISTYAVVKDGIWYEKGTMGWWAISTNEDPNWHTEFNNLIDNISDDTLISLFDCHI